MYDEVANQKKRILSNQTKEKSKTPLVCMKNVCNESKQWYQCCIQCIKQKKK